jgi:5-methylcytosine-specific restriction endonuclease McrA
MRRGFPSTPPDAVFLLAQKKFQRKTPAVGKKTKAARDRSNAKWNPIMLERRRAARLAYELEHAEEIAAAKALKAEERENRQRERVRAYRKAHPEARRRQKSRAEKRRAAWVRAAKVWWGLTHPAEVAAWYAANLAKLRDRKRVKRHNRRAKERGASGRLSKGLYSRLFTLQRGKCAVCRTPTAKGMHLDHIVPLAGGGTNDDDNIQLLCPPCNHGKRDRHPVEFMQSRGYLL